MIEIPTLGGDISLLEGIMAVALFVTGYVIHELCHILPLWIWGDDYTVEILPTKEGQSKLVALFIGTVVRIEVPDHIPRWRIILAALAPLAGAIMPFYAMMLILAQPVIDIGTGLAVALWFMVAIPSLRDWLTVFTYRREKATVQTEVQG